MNKKLFGDNKSILRHHYRIISSLKSAFFVHFLIRQLSIDPSTKYYRDSLLIFPNFLHKVTTHEDKKVSVKISQFFF